MLPKSTGMACLFQTTWICHRWTLDIVVNLNDWPRRRKKGIELLFHLFMAFSQCWNVVILTKIRRWYQQSREYLIGKLIRFGVERMRWLPLIRFIGWSHEDLFIIVPFTELNKKCQIAAKQKATRPNSKVPFENYISPFWFQYGHNKKSFNIIKAGDSVEGRVGYRVTRNVIDGERKWIWIRRS